MAPLDVVTTTTASAVGGRGGGEGQKSVDDDDDTRNSLPSNAHSPQQSTISGTTPTTTANSNNSHQARHKFSPGDNATRKLRAFWSRVRSSSSRRGSVDTSASGGGDSAFGTSPPVDDDAAAAMSTTTAIDAHAKRVSSGGNMSANGGAMSSDDEEAIADVRAMLQAATRDAQLAGTPPPPPLLLDGVGGAAFAHHTPHRAIASSAASNAAAVGAAAVSPGGRKKKASLCADSGCLIQSVPEDSPLTTTHTTAKLSSSGLSPNAAASSTSPGAADLSNSSAHTTDSAIASLADHSTSRRGSTAGVESGILRPRRMTFDGHLPQSRKSLKYANAAQAIEAAAAATMQWPNSGSDSSPYDDTLSDEEAAAYAARRRACMRRMSVDEKALQNADYAILRKQHNQQFEILGGFSRHETSAFRNYLHSITVYDVLPAHAVVFMINAQLSIRKAIHAMCAQTQAKAAITMSSKTDAYNIFTLSDLLKCLQLRRENPSLGDAPVQDYFTTHQAQKRLVVTGDTASVWDVARLFRMNHVHRIPVVLVENNVRTQDVIGVLSLRPIFLEIAKLIESHCTIQPNLHKMTIAEAKLGKLENLSSISKDAKCSAVVDHFISDRVSCLPLLDEEGLITGAMTKADILQAICCHGEDALDEIMETSARKLANPLNLQQMLISPNDSIATAIHKLIASHHQCLLVTDDSKRLQSVVSYADIFNLIVTADKGTSNAPDLAL